MEFMTSVKEVSSSVLTRGDNQILEALATHRGSAAIIGSSSITTCRHMHIVEYPTLEALAEYASTSGLFLERVVGITSGKLTDLIDLTRFSSLPKDYARSWDCARVPEQTP